MQSTWEQARREREFTRGKLEDGIIGEGELSWPKPEWFNLHGHWKHISELTEEEKEKQQCLSS